MIIMMKDLFVCFITVVYAYKMPIESKLQTKEEYRDTRMFTFMAYQTLEQISNCN
jgi:hypothetical protein